MLEIITAITTTITAIISVYIAYQSHKTTIDERIRSEKELSIKLMELHKSKNTNFISLILLLSKLKITLDNPKIIHNFDYNNKLQLCIDSYIENTKKFKEENILQLSLKDTEKLSKSIKSASYLNSKIKNLLKTDSMAVVILEVSDINNSKEFEEVKEYNIEIQKYSKELLKIINEK